MERCVTSANVFPRRRAKAPWPQVQKLPHPQDTGRFTQDHDRDLAQRPGDPANDRMTNLFSARPEQHSPPRLSRHLRPPGKDWTCECSCHSSLPNTTFPRRPEEDSGRSMSCLLDNERGKKVPGLWTTTGLRVWTTKKYEGDSGATWAGGETYSRIMSPTARGSRRWGQ